MVMKRLIALCLLGVFLLVGPSASARKPYSLREGRHAYVVTSRVNGELVLRCRAESHAAGGIGLAQTDRIALDGRGDRKRVRVLGRLDSVRCHVVSRG